MIPLVITDYLWRYRIGYDLRLRQCIQALAEQIPKKQEREIYQKLISKFSSLVSLSQLAQDLESGTIQIKDLDLPLLSKGVFNITPLVSTDFQNRIRPILSQADFQNICDHLLSDSNNEKIESEPIYSFIFAENFLTSIKAQLASLADTPPIFQHFAPENLGSIVAELNQTYSQAASAAGFSYTVHIEQKLGFAEYWPTLLTNDETNQLIINQNEENTCKHNLSLTLNHEVMPGHGFFYHLLTKENPPFVDHGAFFLVEGWATFCEWMALENPRCAYNRFLGKTILSGLLQSSAQNTEPLRRAYRKAGYKEDYIDSLEISFLQMPGMLEAYYLGALWFENSGIQNATDFQNFMQDRSWGDFFKLWP